MVFKEIVDWMEVWAVLIPIIVFFIRPVQPRFLKPVVIYIFLAFFINLAANISWKFKYTYNFPEVFQVNTYFYSVHAIVRLFLLGWFFILLNQPFLRTIKKIILLLFAIFIVINFMYEPFINYWYEDGKLRSTLSSRLLATEAAIMVFFCLQYYLFNLKNDQEFKKTSDFWVVTGLAVFSFCSLPIYFFYKEIVSKHITFTINIWLVQKITFLVFCICIAVALYLSKRTGHYSVEKKA